LVIGGVIAFGLICPSVRVPKETSAVCAIIMFVERGLLSLAAILFGYSLLRTAERMLIPRHLFQDSSHVELVRILIGEDHPARAMLKAAKESVALAGGLMRDAAALVHGEKEKEEKKR
jgi:hypothetical protein